MSKYYYLIGVPKIQQQAKMDCWYAAARMVTNSFIFGPSFGMGKDSMSLFKEGLSNDHYEIFARNQRFCLMDDSEGDLMDRAGSFSRDYPGVTFQSLVYMLDKYGPLWVVIARGSHAVVIVGVRQGDDEAERVFYNDPDDGVEKGMGLAAFNKEVVWGTRGVLQHYPSKTPGRFLRLSLDVDPMKPGS